MLTELPLDTIICGDNVEVLRDFPDGCIDLTVTSPPYDNLREYKKHSWDFEGVAQQLWRVTKPGGVVVWVVGDATVNGSETGTSFRQALQFMEIGFTLHDTMIYQKRHLSFPPLPLIRYYPGFEYMFVLSRGRPVTFNPIVDRVNKTAGRVVGGTNRLKNGTTIPKYCSGNITRPVGVRFNVWLIEDGKGRHNHPAPFPEALARDHILSWSNPGDVVLDPFNGSGTTCKMALLNGRHYIGIEISREYCDMAERRIHAVKQKMADEASRAT